MGNVNDVRLVPVCDLLDGKHHFYIPDYQRGYRWTPQQVEELLKDLLLFHLTLKEGNDHTNDLYCLQPVVVRKNKEDGRYEVIDGQQRLTTIKIILHYLKQKMPDDYKSIDYTIDFATRKKSNDFIERLGTDDDVKDIQEPIDFYFMRGAYDTVKHWFESAEEFEGKGACDICDRFGLHTTKTKCLCIIMDILVAKPDIKNATAQVLWYEVDDKEDGIKLFNRLNTGKLELTDAELVKGLFLLRSNFAQGEGPGGEQRKEDEQMKMALQWERMENVLHNDSFWSFLTPRKCGAVPNRIDLLLQLVYLQELRKEETGKDEKKIEQQNKSALTRKYAVFNYYNDKCNVSIDERQKVISEEWAKIKKAFAVLEDWYSDPEIYNLIGFVRQTSSGEGQAGVAELAYIYSEYLKLVNEQKKRDDIIAFLNEKARTRLAGVKCHGDKENPRIELFYDKDGKLIFDLLLLLNVVHMNNRVHPKNGEKRLVLENGEIELCKFPFAVMRNAWDIEHVDSQTVNELKKWEDKRTWISTAVVDLEDRLRSGDHLQELAKFIKSETFQDGTVDAIINHLKDGMTEDKDNTDEIIRYLRCNVAEEIDLGDDKDNIGNLVLLDAGTNRSYKNDLFISKRKTIIKRRESGQYVPETTSYVFFKLFEQSASSRWIWGAEDRKKYVRYIIDQLKEYLPEWKEEKE